MFIAGLDAGSITIMPNLSAHEKGDYKVVGHMLATMLLQEGPPLTLFSPSLAMFLATGDRSTITPHIEEVYDATIRKGLQQVLNDNGNDRTYVIYNSYFNC